jgi:transposase-like protein
MADYRVPELDLSKRIQLALEMLPSIPERAWGRVVELAHEHGVSRQFLYDLRDQAREGVESALRAQKPGPRSEAGELVVDGEYIQRVVTVLAMQKGSIRDIQQGLELLFGVERSVGYISETLQKIGAIAAAYNESLVVPLPILGEADEIFQGRQPCLTVVDGQSFLVLHLSPSETRDGTAWGLTFLNLKERGVQFHDLASDGAGGIQAGMREAALAVPWRPDLFHLLQEAHDVGRKLANAAYRAIRLAERARQAEREAQAPKPRRGRRLKVTVPLEQAEAREDTTITTYDAWSWLLAEIHRALEPITPAGQLVNTEAVCATVETAAELMLSLAHKDITAFAQKLLDQLDTLLAPLIWLEQTLAPWRAGLDAATEAFILWTWQHRQDLNLKAGAGFPDALHDVVCAFWEALSLFHRASSLAESFHSWLRPYLEIHRGMPQWLFPLLMLFWNHHTFQRGKRAGHSPLALAGVDDAPSLSEALDWILQAMASLPETLAFPSSAMLSQMAA